MSETHLSLPFAGILCVSAESLLLGPPVNLSAKIRKYFQTRGWRAGCVRSGFWTVRVLEPAASAEGKAFPFLERPVSCLLGSQHLGNVLIHGPYSDSTYKGPSP